MKKIVVIICIVLLLIGCTKIVKEKNKLNFEATDNYRLVLENKDDIKELIITEISEGGKLCYDGIEVIDEVLEALDNIKEITETNIEVTDDDTIYEFILNDKAIVKFSFNGNSYVYNNKKYEVSNFYKISTRNLKEIDCE